MFDSPGDDEFNTTAIYGALSGDGFHNQAEDFDSVNAYANAGGHDVAKMFDSAGDEIFYGTPTESSLYQLGLFHHRAVSFEEVHAYATAGGFDQADLVGSVQDDTLYATSVEQVLYNDDFLIRAKHFEEVRSHTDQGGVDKAYVVGAVLEAQSRAPDAARSDATSAKVAWLFDFEEVYDLDEPGDDLDEPVVDDVFAYWPA